jgi:hypothetical protein
MTLFNFEAAKLALLNQLKEDSEEVLLDRSLWLDPYEEKSGYRQDRIVREVDISEDTLTYSSEHAGYVYFGTQKMPPRPWVEMAYDEQSLKQAFIKGLLS